VTSLSVAVLNGLIYMFYGDGTNMYYVATSNPLGVQETGTLVGFSDPLPNLPASDGPSFGTGDGLSCAAALRFNGWT
jgi:hypothetical protein